MHYYLLICLKYIWLPNLSTALCAVLFMCLNYYFLILGVQACKSNVSLHHSGRVYHHVSGGEKIHPVRIWRQDLSLCRFIALQCGVKFCLVHGP